MAENNSIRANNASGYSENFAQELTAFASTSQELRDVVKALINAVNKLDKNLNNKSTGSKTDKTYENNLKQLKSSKDAYSEANKLITKASHDVYNTFEDMINAQKTIQHEEQKLVFMRRERDKATENKRKKVEDEYSRAIKRSETRIDKLQEHLDNYVTRQNDTLRKAREGQKQIIENNMQAISDLSSSMEAFKPERMRNWTTMKTNIANYLNPKNSREFSNIRTSVQKQDSSLAGKLSSLFIDKSEIQKEQNALTKRLNLAKDKLEEAVTSGNKIEEANLQEQIKLLESEELINKQKIDLLDSEINNTEDGRILINKQMDNLEQETNVFNNIKESAIKFIQKTLTTAVDRELDNLRSAASDVFNSFETAQKTIAKQLKLSSGEYDDLKQQLIDAANEAGKAIDVTQLNEAAVSISEMGIRDTDLIREMAVGIAKLSEAGVSAKLDEETAKQMNATYAQLVKSGVDSATAAETVGKRFDDMIAIQEQIRQQYHNTFALENGGWQEIMNWVNKIEGMGLIGSEEDRQALMASLANSQAALASAGITDPSAMLSTVESMMQNPLGENSAFVNSWLYDNEFGVTDINSLYEQLGKGKGGDILMSLNKKAAQLAQQGDYNATAYLKQAYGMDLTAEQLVGLSRLGEAESLYGAADYSASSLEEYGKSVAKGLEEGKYLTATEKLEKTNMELMQELASKYQDIPDGAFWMGEGFNEIKNIVDGAVNFLLTGLFSGNLFGGGSGGSGLFGNLGGAGGSRVPAAFGGEAMGLNASIGGMAIGGVLSGASAIKNFSQAEDFEDGLISTFRDPQFTAGLGTVIGSAVGGPVGGVIGGILGSFVPTVSEKLEEWVVSTVHDPEAERMEKQAQALEDAAKRLGEAATAHQNASDKLKTEITEQQDIFAGYDENQKTIFLKQQGYTEEQIKQLEAEGKTNEAFDAAVQKWIADQNAKAENEALLASGTDDIMDSFASAIGIDNAANWDKNDLESMVAKARSINLEGYNDMSDKELAAALNAYDENIANKQLIRTESGYKTVESAKTYAKNKLGKDVSTEEAMKLYLTDIDAGYSEEQIQSMAAEASSIDVDKNAYNEANERFHSRLKSVLDDHPDIKDWKTIGDYYKLKYGSEKDIFNVIENSVKYDAFGVSIDGSDKFTGSLPDLKHTSTSAGHYDYDPSLYEGKFLTGLDYVPMDNFLALLHQGEMVLTKNEAETYRDSFNSNDITNSVDSQTDKLIDILNKILQVITIKYNSGSSLPKSLVQMNSDISLLG